MRNFNRGNESRESAVFSRRILILLIVLYVLEGLYFVAYGDLNMDEGWYLYASKLVYEGHVPYRDFAYFHTPLLPYIYGIPQLLFGSSILVGRLTSFIFGLGVLYFSAKLAKKIAGTMATGIVLLQFCSTAFLVYTFAITKTEALTSFLAVLSLYSLLACPTTLTGAILSASSMLWASAARVSYVPSFLLMLGIVLYRNSHSRPRIATILFVVLAQGGILFGLPLSLARDRMLFNVILVQLARASRLATESHSSLPSGLAANVLSNIAVLQSFMFVIALLTLGILALVRFGWRGSISPLAPIHKKCATIGIVVLTVYLPNLVVPIWNPVYFVPAFSMLAILVGVALERVYDWMSDSLGKQFVLSFVLALFATQFLTAAAISKQYSSVRSPDLKGLGVVAAYVQGAVPQDMELATSSTYIAIGANRRLAHELEMAMYSFSLLLYRPNFPQLSDSEATRYSIVNRNMVRRALLSPETGAVLLTDFDLRRLSSQPWSPQLDEDFSQDQLTELLPELRGRYALIRVVPDFGQWKEHLYILLRTDM